MPEPPVKLVKGLYTNENANLSSERAGRLALKLLYEFWGFVVNGTSDLNVPGGFAASGISVPAGFESGSTVLATGADGATERNGRVFISNSVDWSTLNLTGSLENKYIVAWRPDSTSYDDGIYRIMGVESAGRVLVDVGNGGSPRRGNRTVFNERSGINFRVVDLELTTQLTGWADGQGLVFQFNGAPDVNSGQRTSQARIVLRDQTRAIDVIISPSGSWSSSSFTDGSTAHHQVLFGSGSNGAGLFNLAGGRDFLMFHVAGVDGAWHLQTTNAFRVAGFHIEIPRRLYPPELDPNPITFTTFGLNSGSVSQTGPYNSFKMLDHNGVLRTCNTLVRSPMGSHFSTAFVSSSAGVWQGVDGTSLYSRVSVNVPEKKRLVSDGVLQINVSGSYSFCRARLRHVKFTTNTQEQGTRVGTDWVFVDNGVLWPWNNVVLPYGPFWEFT